MARVNAWVIGPDGNDQCSASADTVVIESDDDDNIARVKKRSVARASACAMKKAAVMCEACESRTVNTAACISGNLKLCEMCDLAKWAAGMCSACGDCPALPQAQKKCHDQHLCLDCDGDMNADSVTPEASHKYNCEYVHLCVVCWCRPAMRQTEHIRSWLYRDRVDYVIPVPLCSAYLCDVCDIERWVQRHGVW